MNLKQIIKMAELFRGLDDEQVQYIADLCHEQNLVNGTTIFEQGDAGDNLYIVGRGQVEVSIRDADGTSRPAVYLGEGQVFGEMALIDDAPRSASVIGAEDPTLLYSMSSKEFIALCQSNTEIGFIMMRNIAQDLSFKLRHRDYDPSKNQ